MTPYSSAAFKQPERQIIKAPPLRASQIMQQQAPARIETPPQAQTETKPVQQAESPARIEQPGPSLQRGRPRSEKARKRILDATNKLLLHMSVQEMSIEAIAKKAKVGKTTIYRWWPNKTAVVMDALASQPSIQAPMHVPKNNADAVRLQLEKLIRLLDSRSGETIAQLFSEAQTDEKAYKIFQDSFLSPLIDALEYSIDQGKKAKEFRTNLETQMAVDILCGPIFFRLMAHPRDFDEHFKDYYPKEAVKLICA